MTVTLKYEEPVDKPLRSVVLSPDNSIGPSGSVLVYIDHNVVYCESDLDGVVSKMDLINFAEALLKLGRQ